MLDFCRRLACLLLLACAGAAQAQSESKPATPDPVVRPASPAPARPTGGPDAGGYTYTDSNAPGGPAYGWIDISAVDTPISLTDDSHFYPFTLPFTFQFYGVDRTNLAIASNGTVYFENSYLGLSNSSIPSTPTYTMAEYAFIAAYWDDLAPNYGGTVSYAVVGSAPRRRAVVQFEDISHCCSTNNDPVSWQVVLYEGSNDIRIQYANPSARAGSGATVGIQASPSVGLEYSENEGVLAANLAICFEPAGSTSQCEIQYEITATASPAAGGSVTGTGAYAENAPVSLTAVPAAHYAFTGWSGDLTSTDNPLAFNATADVAVVANFAPVEYTFDVTTVGNGSVAASPAQATYHAGDVVRLTATAAPGWTFAGWSGDAAGNANPIDVVVTGDMNVVATFTQDEYTLTLTTAGSGSVAAAPSQATYHYGDVVNLTATAAPGWTFTGWSVDASGSASPLPVTITGNTAITATFAQDAYALDVAVVGSGSVARSPQQASYTFGQQVTLTATAQPGWTFAGWSGGASGSANPLTVTVNGNTAITATFTQNQYTLAVATVGSGSVARSPQQATYTQGQVVTLTATADAGWTFAGWSGAASGTANPVTVTMNANADVTATFVQNYTLAVATTGSGSVARSPDQATYAPGTVVTLTATPAAGSRFAGWSGAATGTANPVTVTMNANASVTAAFVATPYTVSATPSGNGTVSFTPAGPFAAGDQVTFTATAAPGWTFVGWTGTTTGSANPLTITLQGNVVLQGVFTQMQPATIPSGDSGTLALLAALAALAGLWTMRRR